MMTAKTLKKSSEEILKESKILKEGGGESGKKRQQKLGRLTARERLSLLLDEEGSFFEIGLFAAYGMYEEWGNLPAAGVITGIGTVAERSAMIIANDATVKAGAFFPQSVKKVLRAQRIAYENRLPLIYLVDSSGVFLPLQDEIFPDEDDFGRIFRNNAVLSAEGIPQFAAIMGNCIAGGGYLPVLCDQVLMTEGSGLYLAGPALVKAAIGQEVTAEELGGAHLHASISGTVDYIAKDDPTCIQKLRHLISLLPSDPALKKMEKKDGGEIYKIIGNSGKYEMRALLEILFDKGSLLEYKKEYGKTLLTLFGRMGGCPVGVIANEKLPIESGQGEVEVGGVIYSEGADKAARFILECNQLKIPLIFFQDVVGFMVGKRAEASGIIRNGAKLVNSVSNSIVPKITCIIGNSFGAGHYALGGKAYDPRFILAWPTAKYAVMGSSQARDTLQAIEAKAAEKKGVKDFQKGYGEIEAAYEKQMEIRYAAARGWVDAIIPPEKTRDILIQLLGYVSRVPVAPVRFHTGVIQT